MNDKVKHNDEDHSCAHCEARDRKKFIYFIGMTSALAGLLFGMDQGVITGALPFLVKEFHLGPVTKGMVVSLLFIGALLGTALSTVLARVYGRRASKKVSAIMFIVGAIFIALSPSAAWVVVGRIIVGLAIGVACYITPLYLSEISPPRIRGGMIGLYQFMINIGLLVAFLSDTFFAQFAAWRWMFAVVAIPAVLMFILVYRLPRSPRWLFLREQGERATEILTRLLPKEEVQKTIDQIHANLHKPRYNLRQCFAGKNRFISLVLLGAGIMFFQQWTGIDAILYYATDIYRLAGFKSVNAQMWCIIAFAVFNCFSTIIAIRFVIDKLGRRKSLYISLVTMAIALFACGYVIKLSSYNLALTTNNVQHASVCQDNGASIIRSGSKNHYSYAIGFCSATKSYRTIQNTNPAFVKQMQKVDVSFSHQLTVYKGKGATEIKRLVSTFLATKAPHAGIGPQSELLRLIGLISTFVYILGFGVSIGPVAWILCSEIFPLQVRETGVMLTTVGNWLSNLVLMQIFPLIVGYGAFWIFAAISVVGIFYVYFLVPETKGVPLETIEENLRAGKPLAQLGLPMRKL